MKRIFALLIVLFVLLSCCVISASAVTPAKTQITVNKGDVVEYTLNLTLPKKLVGWDFSIYYDSTKLKVTAVTDYSGGKSESEYESVVNYNLQNEVRNIHSILSGVECNNKAFITVKFEAVTSQKADTNITYYVRYLYPESMKQFTDYEITCDVSVNGTKIADNAQPELNVNQSQMQGEFKNSFTGKGEDAGVDLTGKTEVDKNNATAKDDKDEENIDDDNKTEKDNDITKENKEDQTVDETTDNTDAVDKDTDKDENDEDDDDSSKDFNLLTTIWFWAIFGVLVVGISLGIFLILFNKK